MRKWIAVLAVVLALVTAPWARPNAQQCTTPDPFVALGGGICCQGGWLPPGMTCAVTPPPPVAPPAGPPQGPFVEGTASCRSTIFWFANADYSPPGLRPVLTLYNGGAAAQTATLRTYGGVTLVHSVVVDGKERMTIDIGTALLHGVATALALEVEFQALGAAELRVWSGASAIQATPLTLCR